MPEQEPDADEIEDKTNTDSEENIQLTDPEDYHRRQRLKEIHKRRQQVSKALDDMDRYTTKDEHEKQQTALVDAVVAYIAELEPLILRTDASPDLPDNMPWDSVSEYADLLGHYHEDGNREKANYHHSMKVFRACNQYLAKIRPLIDTASNEAESDYSDIEEVDGL